MKVSGAKKVHYDSGPNMTPLVDVVMVILIFLMLAGSFAGTTRFIISKAAIHDQGVGGKKSTEESIDVPTEININHQTGGGFVAMGTGIKPMSDPAEITAFSEQQEPRLPCSAPIRRMFPSPRSSRWCSSPTSAWNTRI